MIAVCALAAAGGAWRVGERSIQLDEATSIKIASTPYRLFAYALGAEQPNMRLYYSLLSVWVRMFGDSESAARSLSVIFAALAAATVCVLGRRLFGRAAGLLAGVLFAFDAFVVQYAQSARSYALVLFLVCLSSLCLVRAHDRPTARRLAAYAIVSALSFYAHFFASLVILSQLAAIVALRRREFLERRWIVTFAALLALCLPAFLWATKTGTYPITWIERPSAGDVAELFREYAGYSYAVLFALAACSLFSIVRAFRKRDAAAHVFLVIWLILPIVTAYSVSFVQPVFEARYLIISLPPLVLLAGSLTTALPSPVIRNLIALLLVAFTLGALRDWYYRPVGEDWRSAAQQVLAAANDGDAVTFYPSYARKPFRYYTRRHPSRALPELKEAPRATRVWLLVRESDAAQHPEEVRDVRASLASTFPSVERTRFRYVTVDLYGR